MTAKPIFQITSFFLYVLVQGLLLQNVVAFDVAFCFAYVAFLLCLPVDSNALLLLGMGFLTGLSVDIFYDSVGMHAAASVLIMFVRNYWLNTITPQGGYDIGVAPNIDLNGWQWFLGYILPLIFLHHTALFFIESASFSLFWFTLLKVFASTIFTVIVIVIIQFLFYRSKRY